MFKFKWIPNILSGLRILLAMAFPFANPDFRILLVCLALLTEYSDGLLARKYNWVTNAGQLLDPIADKLFALSVGLSFVAINKLSLKELLFLSARDVVAAVGFIIIVLVFRNYKMIPNFQPNFLGKLTTAFQYFVFLDILLTPAPDARLILLTGTLSLIAAIRYTWNIYLTFK